MVGMIGIMIEDIDEEGMIEGNDDEADLAVEAILTKGGEDTEGQGVAESVVFLEVLEEAEGRRRSRANQIQTKVCFGMDFSGFRSKL